MSKAILVTILLAAIPVVGMAQGAAPEQPPAAQTQAAAEGDPSKMASPPAAPGVAVDGRFVIGPEDQIFIDVWGNQGIGGPALVRPDGRVSVALLGDVQAAGRTPVELGNEIAEMLKQKEILRRPQVTVRVLDVRSKNYKINGEVMKTGAFPLVVATRVMDALVNAGGFKDFADKKNIVIIRGDKRLRFNWNEVVKGKKTDQNIFLEHGDIIIVK